MNYGLMLMHWQVVLLYMASYTIVFAIMVFLTKLLINRIFSSKFLLRTFGVPHVGFIRTFLILLLLVLLGNTTLTGRLNIRLYGSIRHELPAACTHL